MAKTNNLTDFLTDVADAIREKEGSTEAINPQNFNDRVRAIAGLEEKEQVAHTELDSFLLDLADTIREAEGSTEAINPQDFGSKIRAIEIKVEDTNVPIYIEAIADSTISFSNTYQYSRDMKSWTNATSSTSIYANSGEKIYFRASGLSASSSNGIGRFTISNDCNVGGNVMSLVYGADYIEQYKLQRNYALALLFKGQPIVSAKKLILPANQLSSYCYREMFRDCTSLVDAPELPATNTVKYCYYAMFRGCTSLVTAPELPATNTADYCYYTMFYDCTNLVNVPAKLPATTLASNCYGYMFQNTSIVNAPELPATTLASNCYYQMFLSCANLINAPELPATTLASNCYRAMFYGCTSLVDAPELPATNTVKYCYYTMFRGCTSLVTAPELPATNTADYCYAYMFMGCTSLINAPELPATTLAANCYKGMFDNAASLQYIKMMSLTAPSEDYTSGWVAGVSANGTFVKNSAATWDNVFGDSSIPTDWAIETASE